MVKYPTILNKVVLYLIYDAGSNAFILLALWILSVTGLWKEEVQEIDHVLRPLFHYNR